MLRLAAKPVVLRRRPRLLHHRALGPHAIDVSVFQVEPPCGHVTLRDVEDALDVCASMPHVADREDYCTTRGIHYIRAIRYYGYVMRMNRMWRAHEGGRADTPPSLPARVWAAVVFAVYFVLGESRST